MPRRSHGFGATDLAEISRSRAVQVCLVVLACAVVGGGAWATGFGWPLANFILLGFPSMALVVVFRESIRIGLAWALGFQLFGVKWGTGDTRLQFRLGGVHHRIGAIPLGGDTRVASIRPRHHRIARICIAVVPLLVQGICGLIAVALDLIDLDAMREGFAPLATLHIANVTLIVLHLIFAIDAQSGWATDLRRINVMIQSTRDDARAARATAPAMRIELALERGEVENATRELDRAMAQLGREPMLVAIESRLTRIKNAPDPAAAGRMDAISDPFEHAHTRWDRLPAPRPLSRRALGWMVNIAPLALALTLLLVVEHDSLIASAHDVWIGEAQSVSVGRDVAACESQLLILEKRIARLDLLVSVPRELQIQQLRARAALNACTRDFERAVRDQALAVTIADAMRRDAIGQADVSSPQRIEAELIHSSELRQLAAWHAARGAFRDALRTTQRANEALLGADQRATDWPESKHRDRTLGLLAQERRELEYTRKRILLGMGVKG